MSSSACCSTPSADTYGCHWSCEQGFGCDLSPKAAVPTRRKREFTPDELKDDNYWMKRSRNNQAAKRSRERRRMEERLLEDRTLQLLRENEKLRAALSTVNYHGVAQKTSHDTFLDCFPVPELARDSYLRFMADFQAANGIPHYALSSRCDFTSAYNSVLLPRLQSFPGASFHPNNTHLTDRCMGIHARYDGNVSSSADVPYAITQSKWAQGHAHPTVNLYPHSAPFSQNEVASGYRCPASTTSGCAAHVRMNVEQRARVTEPKDLEDGKEAERVSTSPLLPHKLRYKINKLRLGGDFSLYPGINA